jgi:hypothetical protein
MVETLSQNGFDIGFIDHDEIKGVIRDSIR